MFCFVRRALSQIQTETYATCNWQELTAVFTNCKCIFFNCIVTQNCMFLFDTIDQNKVQNQAMDKALHKPRSTNLDSLSHFPRHRRFSFAGNATFHQRNEESELLRSFSIAPETDVPGTKHKAYTLQILFFEKRNSKHTISKHYSTKKNHKK